MWVSLVFPTRLLRIAFNNRDKKKEGGEGVVRGGYETANPRHRKNAFFLKTCAHQGTNPLDRKRMTNEHYTALVP